MNSTTEAIRAEKLVKTFGSVTALAGVSLIDSTRPFREPTEPSPWLMDKRLNFKHAVFPKH